MAQTRGWKVSLYCTICWVGLAIPLGVMAQVPLPSLAFVASQPIGHVQEQRITIELHNVPMHEALRRIAVAAGLAVGLSRAEVSLDRKVSVSVKDAPLHEVLAKVVQGSDVEATVSSDGQTILVGRASQSKSSEQSQVVDGTVVGRVTDSASGKGVSGATVGIVGSKGAVLTSERGAFVLKSVPAGKHQLTVKMIGYKTVSQTVTVVEQESVRVHVMLVPTTTILSGVVTTATGVQQKLAVGNDITTINVDSVMQVAPVTSVTDLLETRVPGLTVQRTSGTPGDPSRLRLRGASSVLRSNDPIVIVDGIRVYADQSNGGSTNLAEPARGTTPSTSSGAVGYARPSPLDQIDPNNIETIEVFKGPSASSMYGSDAANGVIVITTKQGHAGPTRWTAAVNQGISYLPGSYPENVFRWGHTLNGPSRLYNVVTGGDVPYTLDSIVQFQALNDPRYTVLHTGSDSRGSLTVSGGTSALMYSVTGSASTTSGLYRLPEIEIERFNKFHSFRMPGWMRRPDQLKTWSGNSALTAQIGKDGTIRLLSTLMNNSQRRSSLGQSAISTLLGLYVDSTLLAQQGLFDNIYERVTSDRLTATNALTVNYPVFSWLPINLTVGINTGNSTDRTLQPRNYKLDADSVGHFSIGRGTTVDKTVGLNTTIPVPMGLRDKRINLAVGMNYVDESASRLTSSVTGLALGVSAPTTLVSAGGNSAGSSTQSDQRLKTFGWFLEPRLNVNSRFFVIPAMRLDNNGLSGITGFPKVSLSYVASDESFFPFKDFVSLFRLRFAYGRAGVQPAPGDQLRLYRIEDVPIQPGEAPTDVIGMATVGNTQLRPERSTETEGGFDLEVWQGRLMLQVTGYRKVKNDALLNIPLAPSLGNGLGAFGIGSGYGSVEKNIGVIRNTGTEIGMSAQIIQQSSLSWLIGGNMSTNRNVIVRLAPGILPTPGLSPGYPLNGVWDLPIIGYADANHDGVISSSEVRIGDTAVYKGSTEPKYSLNLNSTLTLLQGRLSVNSTVAYTSGVTQTNQLQLQLAYGGAGGTALLGNELGATPWEQAGVAAGNGKNIDNRNSHVWFTQTVNTLRWQSLSMNYIVPRTLSRQLHVPRMTVALQGSNLGLRTSYSGKDPNVNQFSSGNSVLDSGQLPQPRTWSVRITVGND